METKNPVPGFYYSPNEWDRLGCGPLPPERDVSQRPPTTQENKNETNTDN